MLPSATVVHSIFFLTVRLRYQSHKTEGNTGVSCILILKLFYTADSGKTGSYRKGWLYWKDKMEAINMHRLRNIRKMWENKMKGRQVQFSKATKE